MRRNVIFALTVVTCILFSINAAARIYIPIDQPIDKKFPIAVADLVKLEGGGIGSAKNMIPAIIKNDLELTGYFQVIPKGSYRDKSDDISADTIDFSKWTSIGALALVKGCVKREEGRMIVQLKLFDTKDKEMLTGKQYTFERNDVRNIAHRFSDEIMLSLTGIRGVFGTKIAFASERKKRGKQIFIMDMDGENVKRLTSDKSISIGPSWSTDGQKIAYASYLKGTPDIYVIDVDTKKIDQLTNNRATNITPEWSPTGAWIAYASSVTGNMEIYAMTPNGDNNRKLTNAFGIDIAPNFSPDGNAIVYASERGGNLQIYKQSLLGGEPKRLTFVGSQNDSPAWSPDGEKVAFCGRTGGVHDIFTVNIDGSNLERLTVGGGNNEHPRWSPDGRFIVFNSSRYGKPQIYMMRYDGAHQIQLNKKVIGITPDWGPWEY